MPGRAGCRAPSPGKKKGPGFLPGPVGGDDLLSRALDAVPSALAVLTSLFGMGRGGTRRFRHHVPRAPDRTPSTRAGNREHPLQENLGLLVPLGFAVAGFTPAAYPRRRLRRPSTEVSSSGEFRT